MNVKSQVSIVDCSHLTSFLIVCFSDGGPPKERPRLQLAKRTAPAEGAAPASSGSDRPAPPAAKSNPFGNAKPIDSAAKEREIEEKLAKDKPQYPRNTREQRSRTTSERSDDSRENNRQKDAGEEKSDRPAPPAAKSNPFGNAKPVDRSERPERSADDSRENNRQIEEEPKSDRPAPPAKSDRPAPPAAKSNPFGNAKPVDRSERPERSADDSRENNRQIEEEPKSDRPAPPAKSDRPAPRASNPFGNAKPIDSTKREKEMEEKLRKTDISDDKPRSNQQKSQHRDEKTTTNYDEKSGGDESKKVRSPPPPKEIEEPPVSYSTFSVTLVMEFF